MSLGLWMTRRSGLQIGARSSSAHFDCFTRPSSRWASEVHLTLVLTCRRFRGRRHHFDRVSGLAPRVDGAYLLVDREVLISEHGQDRRILIKACPTRIGVAVEPVLAIDDPGRGIVRRQMKCAPGLFTVFILHIEPQSGLPPGLQVDNDIRRKLAAAIGCTLQSSSVGRVEETARAGSP